jgi:hypothetical protein
MDLHKAAVEAARRAYVRKHGLAATLTYEENRTECRYCEGLGWTDALFPLPCPYCRREGA